MDSRRGGHQRIGVGAGKGPSGLQALNWLLNDDVTSMVTLVLVHVYPRVQFVPTGLGNLPVSQVDEAIVKAHKAAKLKEAEETLKPYTLLCRQKQITPETCLIDTTDSVQKELVNQIFKLGLSKLVLGTARRSRISAFVSKNAPDFCTIMVIQKGKLSAVKQATAPFPSSVGNSGASSSNILPDSLQRQYSQQRIAPAAGASAGIDGKMLAEEQAKQEAARRMLHNLFSKLEREVELRREAEQKAEIAKREAIAVQRKLQISLSIVEQKYANYSFEELKQATGIFAEKNKLGQGGYGPVFKGNLHHIPVAIKLLAREGAHGREEFQREVEILGNLHHPHIVMLLGACAEKGCIVYEYMANGSLADRLACKDGTPPLPWFVRFRICAEIASALLFLHTRPTRIVHRDLKPGNILLDQHFVSKVSDVGIAKLVTNNMTYGNKTLLRGTSGYIDPEYVLDGEVSCESDVYALGIVMLQILSGKPPARIAKFIEDAIKSNKFHEVLDKSAGAWPVEQAMELARLALECADPSRQNRPELDSKVLPILEKLQAYADDKVASMAESQVAEPVIPDFFLCPISQEIMEDPCLAADGYTYERRVIEQWLQKHDTSPMTNLRLNHKDVTPNYVVRSAIKDWIDKTTPPATR